MRTGHYQDPGTCSPNPTSKQEGPRCARQRGGHAVGWHSPEITAGPGTSRPGQIQVTHGQGQWPQIRSCRLSQW